VRVAEAARSSGVSLAGARFVLGSEPVTPARLAAIRRAGVSTSSVYGSMDAGLIGEPCAVDTLAGFDRDYFLYQEDADLCLRARRAGYRIGYADESVVHHLHRQSQPELSEYEYARRVFGRSAVFWEKHYPPRDVLRIVRFQYWISRLLLGLEPARRWTPQWPSVLSAPRLRARRDVCLEWLNRNGHGRVGLTGFPGKIALRHCHVVVEWLRQRRFPLDDY
jgi:cellulose synthase/poly-beta-1,6-N-acetylglucosamine synthase-like glycosyltransferase